MTHLNPDIELPEGWHLPRVIDIAARRANATVGGPFGSDLVANDYVDSGVPVIRGQNMGQRYVAGEFAFVSPAKAKALQANLARPSDLVFTQRGTLGQVALIPTGPYEEYLISQSQMKLTLDCGAAVPGYVHQYFASALGQKQILDSAIQTGVPHTNLGILRNYAVPMPRRVDEQEAIAAALTDADTLIDSLEQLLTKKRQIKQGAMQELLTGKRRLPGFSASVPTIKLGTVCKMQSGGTPPATQPSFFDGPHHWVAISDITQANKYLFTTDRSLSDAGLDASPAQIFPKGTVLYAMYASVGECCIATMEVCTSQAILAMQPIACLDSEYLYYWLCSSKANAKSAVQQGTQGNLNKGIVQDMSIRQPDIREQQAIAKVLSDMDSDIAATEERLTKARALKQAMAQALLTGRIRLAEPTT